MRDEEMLGAMARYGGGFVQQLYVLLRVADPENYARLEQAFPEIFERYRAAARYPNARGSHGSG